MNIKSIFVFVLILILALSQYSCEDWGYNTIRGNDNFTAEQREVNESIYDVKVDGSLNVYIDTAAASSIVVEADENLLQYIVTDLNNGKLYIHPERNKNLRSKNPIDVYVYTNSELESADIDGSGMIDIGPMESDELGIDLDGSGNIYFEGLTTGLMSLGINGSGNIDGDADADKLEAEVNGSGDIKVEGTVNDADLNVTGSGNINASQDITINDCNAEVTGSGQISVYIIDHLNAKITGSGTIYYTGTTSDNVSKKVTGSGKIIKR